jgi:hypothetical protein
MVVNDQKEQRVGVADCGVTPRNPRTLAPHDRELATAARRDWPPRRGHMIRDTGVRADSGLRPGLEGRMRPASDPRRRRSGESQRQRCPHSFQSPFLFSEYDWRAQFFGCRHMIPMSTAHARRTSRLSQCILSVGLLLLLVGCADSTSGPHAAPPVASVEITGGPSSPLQVGQSVQLSAVAMDAQGRVLTGRIITWQTSDPALASVDSTGRVHALAAGDVTITASSEGVRRQAGLQILPTLISVQIEIAGTIVEPGDTVQLRLMGRYTNGSSSALTAGQIRWSANDPTLASVEPSGQLIARGPGTIRVTGEYSGLTSSSELVIPPFQVDRVTLQHHRIEGMLVGGSWQLRWQAVSRGGRTLPADVQPTFGARSSGVVALEPSGHIRGVSPGTTIVIAEAVSGPDSITVTVLPATGNLGLVSIAPVEIEPRREITFHGTDLTDVFVTISGQTVPVTVSGDTLIRLEVPQLSIFQPCLPPSSLPISIRAGARLVSLTAPAEAPLPLPSRQGEHTLLGASYSVGCRFELDVGRHLIVPFAWERKNQATPNVRADTVVLRLDIGRTDGPLARVTSTVALFEPSVGQPLEHLMPSREDLERTTRRLHLTPQAHRAAAAASCGAPTVVGDSMLVLTERTTAGRYTFHYGVNPQRLEWWYLVYQNEQLAVVVDSVARRLYTSQPATASTVRGLSDWYAAEAAPVFVAMFEDPAPDGDANGRMIMFSAANSDAGGGGGSGYYSNAACLGGWTAGEAFYVPFDWFINFDTTPSYLRSHYAGVIMHEAAHTHDLARRSRAHPYGWPPTGPPSSEAMAIMATDLWIRNFPLRPFAPQNGSQPSRSLFGGSQTSPCWRIVSGTLPKTLPGYGGDGGWRDSYGYDQGCQAFQHFLGRALDDGASLPTVLTRFTHASRGTYQDMATALLGRPITGREALGTWLLAWYADDRVGGASSEITNTVFNTPASHEAARVNLPFPDRTVRGAGERLEIILGEPDARFILIEIERPLRLLITQDGGAPDLTAVDIAYLRVAIR